MPQTPNWALPYPSLTDPPNGPAQIEQLAEATETVFDGFNATLSTKIGGEVRASGSQSLFGASNKLTFATNVVTPAGIGWNGSDTWTIQSSGIYSAFCNIRTNGASQGGLALGGTSYTDASLILPPTSLASIWGDYNIGGTVYLAAGTQVCFYFYLNSSNTSTLFSTRAPMAKLWRVF